MPGGPLSCWNAGMGAGGWMTAGRLQAGATVGAFSAALPLAANAGAGAAAAMRRRPAIPAGAKRCAQSGSAVQVGQCGVVFGARFVQLALGLVDLFRLALGASLLEFAFAFGDLVLFLAHVGFALVLQAAIGAVRLGFGQRAAQAGFLAAVAVRLGLRDVVFDLAELGGAATRGRAVGRLGGAVASRARAAAVMSVGNRARMRKTPG